MVTALREARTQKIDTAAINNAVVMTPRVQRLKKVVLEAPAQISGEKDHYFVESLRQTEGEHPAVRKAKAFRNFLEKRQIIIRDDELIVGGLSPYVRGAQCHAPQSPQAVAQLLRSQENVAGTSSAVRADKIAERDRAWILDACDYLLTQPWPEQPLLDIATRVGGQRFWDGYKTWLFCFHPEVPKVAAPGADWGKILGRGLNAIIADARRKMEELTESTPENKEKREWYRAVIIALEAVIHNARRHAELARAMAAEETRPQRKRELEAIAEICERVPANPARNFYEALQSRWFVLQGQAFEKGVAADCMGRFDQDMWPYYHKDIGEGRLTHDQAAELLACCFVKWMALLPFKIDHIDARNEHKLIGEANYFLQMMLGGVDRRGWDASNELTYLVLEVARQVKSPQPHIALRFHRAMAPEVVQKAIECNRDFGAGIPAWFNDRHGTERLLEHGLPMEEARDWAIWGCVGPAYTQSYVGANNKIGFLNGAKLLELALNEGVDPRTGLRLGPSTGDPKRFQSFDEVLEAYHRQFGSLMDMLSEVYNATDVVRLKYSYMPFISSLLEGPLEKGKDATQGGCRYTCWDSPLVWDRAQVEVADSLTAIKKVVFEDKLITMGELLDALKANFEGYEKVRQTLLNAPKYGNDDDEADDMMIHIWEWQRERIESYRDSFGRPYVAIRQGVTWAARAGTMVGALPNGRKAGLPLADAVLSPLHGCDKNGPTAVMNSAAKCDTARLDGTMLNQMFIPSILQGREAMDKFAQLIATYMDNGGYQCQFNFLDKETLRDAKEHPENYRDLVVRVAGYSALWVELPPNVQDEIMSRTEQTGF